LSKRVIHNATFGRKCHELKILDYLQQFKHASSSELQQAFALNIRTLQRDLLQLIKKGLVKKQGEKKNAVYRIIQLS